MNLAKKRSEITYRRWSNTMKFIKTLLSVIVFIIAALIIAVIYGSLDKAFYYILGLGMYLFIFFIPTLIYENNENPKIPYILIILLWVVSLLFAYFYLSVQGMGGAAGTISHTNATTYEHIKAFLIVSFPYFAYVVTFLNLCKLWKECILGCIGYGILFGLFAIV